MNVTAGQIRQVADDISEYYSRVTADLRMKDETFSTYCADTLRSAGQRAESTLREIEHLRTRVDDASTPPEPLVTEDTTEEPAPTPAQAPAAAPAAPAPAPASPPETPAPPVAERPAAESPARVAAQQSKWRRGWNQVKSEVGAHKLRYGIVAGISAAALAAILYAAWPSSGPSRGEYHVRNAYHQKKSDVLNEEREGPIVMQLCGRRGEYEVHVRGHSRSAKYINENVIPRLRDKDIEIEREPYRENGKYVLGPFDFKVVEPPIEHLRN